MLKRSLTLAALLTTSLAAEEPIDSPTAKAAVKVQIVQPETPDPEKEKDPEVVKAETEKNRLATFNALEAEKQKQKSATLRAQIAQLKLEKELLTEKLGLAEVKRSTKNAESDRKHQEEMTKLERQSAIAKLEAGRLANELKKLQSEASLKTTSLEAEIKRIETERERENYVNADPEYLENPLKSDGTLVISDRRIPFNGPVTERLADAVTERINFYNNKDRKKPIFIVIDTSPGGSVMAGYRILKAMEGSEAPVYVVVKSFAASMAACVTTLAEKSFVYPNAIILHHQIMNSFFFTTMNLTEQKEQVEDLKKWWQRLAGPIARKMGITTDEFIEQMYENTVSGDWSEFGDEAVKLKWADHVVTAIEETSLLKDPNAEDKKDTSKRSRLLGVDDLTPSVDDQGKPFMLLPRRHPKDAYLMYNPDNYYRFK